MCHTAFSVTFKLETNNPIACFSWRSKTVHASVSRVSGTYVISMISLKSKACATERKVRCNVFHSSPPPLFFMNMSVFNAGSFASIAAETVLVIVVTSVVKGVIAVGTECCGPESVRRYSSKLSTVRDVHELVVLSPQACQNPLSKRIHFFMALEMVMASVDVDLVRFIESSLD